MFKKLFISISLGITCLFASAQSYKKFHFNSIVVDTHNDLLSKVVDDKGSAGEFEKHQGELDQ